MTLKRPAVLITSGAKRLGLAIAEEAIARGHDVVAHYRSSALPLSRALARSSSMRAHVRLLQADITPENSAEVIAQARALAPRLIGLVNNASTFSPGSLADQIHLRQAITDNALVPAALAEAFRAQVGRGWVINMCDAHVQPLNQRFQNYRISKLLLAELTRQQAFAYAPLIRVNAIAPGAILPARGTSSAEFKALRRAIPMKRTGSVSNIREAFAFLLSASYVTGQVIQVDGGWHLGQ